MYNRIFLSIFGSVHFQKKKKIVVTYGMPILGSLRMATIFFISQKIQIRMFEAVDLACNIRNPPRTVKFYDPTNRIQRRVATPQAKI